jgi:formate-dependent nitrite reductase membrane component NrfD
VSRYYDRSILKQPTWKPEIGIYFFAGGLAGASAVLSFVARMTGNRRLERSGLISAMAGTLVSPLLLIKDLGKPARFHHMLRVFKPTSPMSIGSWILSGFGASITAAAGSEMLKLARPVGLVAHAGSATLGPALATYTAVLVSDTAIPAWHRGRAEMPFLFAGGAAASAGAAAVVLTPTTDAAPARRLAIGGALLEIGASHLMKRRIGESASAYEEGEVKILDRLAIGLSLLGAVAIGGSGKRRWLAVLGGLTLLMGSLSERLAIYRAGFHSAATTTGEGPEGPEPRGSVERVVIPANDVQRLPTESAPRKLIRSLAQRISI